jgi:hypothetical protein
MMQVSQLRPTFSILRYWQLGLAVIAVTEVARRTLSLDCAPTYQLRPDVITSAIVQLVAAGLLIYAFTSDHQRPRLVGVVAAALLVGSLASSGSYLFLAPLAAIGTLRLPSWRPWLPPLVALCVFLGFGLPKVAQLLMTSSQFIC